jgi:hypothetical protein
VVAVFAFFAASSALAQATGKVQGRVVETATGAPLAGASVTVVGTSFGAITGNEGYFFINDIPAGLWTFTAEFIGHRTVQLDDQRVLAGQTTTLDFELDVAAIEIEPLIVLGDREPLVPRDQVSSKAIVSGETVQSMPIDNPDAIITLQPGVVVSACRTQQARAVSSAGATTDACRSIRGSRANEEAVYIDGVRTRRYSDATAQPISMPTNALAQVDVTTGGIGANIGDAQSGVVNYVTRSGGTSFNGAISLETDQVAPSDWATGYTRLELSLGGPISRPNNLGFFLAGTLQGQKYAPLNDGFISTPILLPQGVAQMSDGSNAEFNLARESSSSGASDSVRVAFPNYVEWDNGRTLPFNSRDLWNWVARVTWGFGTGSNLDLSYKRERQQRINLGLGEIYNPDGFDGFRYTGDVATLGGYFILVQKPTSALALDLKASYQRYFDQQGEMDAEWLSGHVDPSFGYNMSTMKFLVNKNDWPVTDALVQAVRSGVMPAESLQVYPGRFDLNNKQSLVGLAENLRLNPYGLRRFYDTSGFGNEGLEYKEETDWLFTGDMDWQLGRYNRIRAGGELVLIDSKRMRVPLFTATAIPALNKPTRAGLYATDRIDLGDVVIDVGLRWDYFDPDGEFPIVPGYVFNVPDSLKADFVRVESGEGPILDRTVPLEDCGGEATAADRMREDGTVVCKPNFISSSSKSVVTPHLAFGFPVTAKSTFRLSYSQNVQVPALMGQSFGGVAAAAGQTSLFNDVYADLQGGLANTNALFGRDVNLPKTTLFEAGYRQLIGESLVLDAALYSKTVRNGLTYRKLPFEDPNTAGQTVFINVLTNKDYSQIRGLDFRLDWRYSQTFNITGNYSFVDARGTGSDPFTYTGLLLRRNTNLSVITGAPVIPPDAILPLETRKHNIGGTISLLFPTDFAPRVFADFGWFTTVRFASGLPFTLLQNSANGQIGPPTFAGLGGTVAEELNSSTTPWERRIDMRFWKGFRIGQGGARLRVFLDWRNPFNLSNTTSVYLETGTEFNDAFKNKLLNQQLTDPLLDGDTFIDDFHIMQESPENELNKFSLLQAERRFGNGDGIYTVAEQRAAFGAQYELFNGSQIHRESNQQFRLGIQFVF